jgi:signal peptidase II
MTKKTIGISLATLILIFDQATKWVVLNYLMVPPQTIPVTSFFNIVLAWNRGVSFGLLSSNHPYGAWILASIALGFSGILTRWIWQAETRSVAVGFGLILGGAIGNLTDRLHFGAVTDFLDFHAFGWHFWAFNVADSAITVGVGVIFLEYFQEIWSKKK